MRWDHYNCERLERRTKDLGRGGTIMSYNGDPVESQEKRRGTTGDEHEG